MTVMIVIRQHFLNMPGEQVYVTNRQAPHSKVLY